MSLSETRFGANATRLARPRPAAVPHIGPVAPRRAVRRRHGGGRLRCGRHPCRRSGRGGAEPGPHGIRRTADQREAKALQAELARLSSTYRRACQEADATNDATVEVDPPEALFWQPGDNDKLWGRFPVESWASPGRHWYADADLIERLRADPFHTLAGTPMKGAARRDEIVTTWDGWRARQGRRGLQRLHRGRGAIRGGPRAYADFRARLVDSDRRSRGDDREGPRHGRPVPRRSGVEACIAAESRRGGRLRGCLSLSLARDFIGCWGRECRHERPRHPPRPPGRHRRDRRRRAAGCRHAGPGEPNPDR